jgi:hypothetical protein
MFEDFHRARTLVPIVDPPLRRDPVMLSLLGIAASSMLFAGTLFAFNPIEEDTIIPPLPTYNTLYWGAIWNDDTPPEDYEDFIQTDRPAGNGPASEDQRPPLSSGDDEGQLRQGETMRDWRDVYGGWYSIMRAPRWSSRAGRAGRPFRGHCDKRDKRNCRRTNNGGITYRG